MSLAAETTEGLLGTHVTWEDIQKDLLEFFGPLAELGSEKKITDIADGRGFVSRIGVMESLWKNKDLSEKDQWPAKLAVKMVTLLQQKKYGKSVEESNASANDEIKKKEDFYKKVHNVETSIYKKLAAESDLKMLKIYKTLAFSDKNPSKGYLLMEYVDNVVQIGTETEFTDELLDQVLKALAKFHSKTPLFSEEEKKNLEMGIYSDMFGKMNDGKFVIPTLDKLAKTVDKEAAEKLRKASEKFAKKDYYGGLDNMAQILGMETILCHGDLWTVNMLFVNNQSEEIQLKALIDFQVTHFGCVGHDLARLLSSVLSSERRKKNERNLISSYFSYLKSSWPKDADMPFTEEQVMESYRRYLPFASFIVAMTLAAVGEMSAQKTPDPEKTWVTLQKKIIDLATYMDSDV